MRPSYSNDSAYDRVSSFARAQGSVLSPRTLAHDLALTWTEADQRRWQGEFRPCAGCGAWTDNPLGVCYLCRLW